MIKKKGRWTQVEIEELMKAVSNYRQLSANLCFFTGMKLYEIIDWDGIDWDLVTLALGRSIVACQKKYTEASTEVKIAREAEEKEQTCAGLKIDDECNDGKGMKGGKGISQLEECSECSDMFCCDCMNKDPTICRYQDSGCTTTLCLKCASLTKFRYRCDCCDSRINLYKLKRGTCTPQGMPEGPNYYENLKEERNPRICKACLKVRPMERSPCCGHKVCVDCISETHETQVRWGGVASIGTPLADSDSEEFAVLKANNFYYDATLCHMCTASEENSGCF